MIVGEPGIGKTTLWLHGVARARELGFRVLSTRADEAESVLAYAAVADLLDDIDPEVLEGRPRYRARPGDWLHLETPDSVTRVRVGPLSPRALHRMISARLGRELTRPAMVRIAEVSGGNPFYALELARGVDGQALVGNADLPSSPNSSACAPSTSAARPVTCC